MKTIGSIFTPHQQALPKTIARAESREEVTRWEAVSPGKMAPGTAAALTVAREERHRTDEDRIVFSNGGTLEDLPDNEMLLTSPDGTTTKMSGWIEPYENNRLEVNTIIYNPVSDEHETWTQGLNSDGTVSFERDLGLSDEWGIPVRLMVAQDGSVTGTVAGNGSGYRVKDRFPDPVNAEAQLSEGNLVCFEGSGTVAISPAVPMDWLIR